MENNRRSLFGVLQEIGKAADGRKKKGRQHSLGNILTLVTLGYLMGIEHIRRMMFFFDNCYMLVDGNDIATRLSKIAEKTGMLLMACDRCCILREIDKKLVKPAGIGCFPNVYTALSGVGVDQVITL